MTIQHYLMTLPIDGGYMHSYVICDDGSRGQRESVLNRMYDTLERAGIGVPFEMVLETQLGAGSKKLVRSFLRKRFPELGRLMKTTDFHMSAWITPPDGPDVDWLMKLH